jgi:hypothetical protein
MQIIVGRGESGNVKCRTANVKWGMNNEKTVWRLESGGTEEAMKSSVLTRPDRNRGDLSRRERG